MIAGFGCLPGVLTGYSHCTGLSALARTMIITATACCFHAMWKSILDTTLDTRIATYILS